MVDYLARPVIHEAFYKKYASKKFLKGTSIMSCSLVVIHANNSPASLLTRQWAKRCAPEFGITDTKLSLDELVD